MLGPGNRSGSSNRFWNGVLPIPNDHESIGSSSEIHINNNDSNTHYNIDLGDIMAMPDGDDWEAVEDDEGVMARWMKFIQDELKKEAIATLLDEMTDFAPWRERL